jgi:hypothetical protein
MDIENLTPAERIGIGSELSDKFSDYESDRAPHEKVWQQCLAFLIGKHWIKWTDKTKTYSVLVNEEDESGNKLTLLKSNLLLSPFKTVVGKLNSIQPILNVLPDESYDEANIDSAKLSDIILKAQWRDLLMRQKMLQKDVIRLCFGYSFLEPYFDPTAGKEIPTEEGEEKKMTGESAVNVLSPFDVYLPNVTANYLIRDCFIAHVKSVDYVFEKYGVVVKAQENLELSPNQNLLNFLVGEATPKKIKNSVMLLEYFELPTDAYPKGRRVALVDKTPVGITELPAEYKRGDSYVLPIRKFDYFQIPLTIYAQGIIEPAISPMKAYNYAISVIKEHMQKMKGKLWTNQDIETEWNDVIGQTIKGTNAQGGAPAGYISPMALPQHYFSDLARIRQDIQDAMNVHDVSMSKTPTGVKSGKAINSLQRGDDEPLSPILQLDEEELAIVGDVLLNIVQNEYSEERLISTVGLNLSYELRQFMQQRDSNKFTGSKDISNKRRVTVQLGSGLPLSLVERQNRLMGLRQLGVKQLMDDDTFLKAMGMGQISEEFKNLDIIAQETENQNMAQGIWELVHEFDNHVIHIKVINDFCKRPSFDKFSKETKNMFTTHRFLHTQSLQRQMIKAQGQMPEGALGGEGGK